MSAAAQSKHSDDDKARFVELATTKGRAAAAKQAKVGKGTITAWARALGVKLPRGNGHAKRAAKKTRGAKKVQQAAAAVRSSVTEQDWKTIDAASARKLPLGAQLRETLRSLEAMQTALRDVFGPLLDGR